MKYLYWFVFGVALVSSFFAAPGLWGLSLTIIVVLFGVLFRERAHLGKAKVFLMISNWFLFILLIGYGSSIFVSYFFGVTTLDDRSCEYRNVLTRSVVSFDVRTIHPYWYVKVDSTCSGLPVPFED